MFELVPDGPDATVVTETFKYFCGALEIREAVRDGRGFARGHGCVARQAQHTVHATAEVITMPYCIE